MSHGFDSLAALVLFAACVTAWALASGFRGHPPASISALPPCFSPPWRRRGRWARCCRNSPPWRRRWRCSPPAWAPPRWRLACLLFWPGRCRRWGQVWVGSALGAGLAAALSGEPVYALGCQLLGVAIIDAVSVNRFFTGPGRAALALLVAQAFFCAGLALMDGAINFAELFFAAGLIAAGRASQPGVET